jgi:hypothetical protein
MMDLLTTAGMIHLLRAERRKRMDNVPSHLFEAPARSVPMRPRRKRDWLGLF